MPQLTQDAATDWLAAIRHSNRDLANLVTPMTAEQVQSPSYPSEWSIAQVLSHLGSSAEIFSMYLDAGLSDSPAPGAEAFQPVWDRWNAKPPSDQARDAILADADFLGRLEKLDEAQRDSWRLEMFGGEQHLVDLLRFRLGEHALHSWDVVVAVDATATIRPEAVTLLIDHLGQLVGYVGKPPPQPIGIAVNTVDPNRELRLHAADGAITLTPQDPDTAAGSDATLRLPAEALIRLVYGRLDPDHTPSLEAHGIDVESLRQMFPGV